MANEDAFTSKYSGGECGNKRMVSTSNSALRFVTRVRLVCLGSDAELYSSCIVYVGCLPYAIGIQLCRKFNGALYQNCIL